MDSDALAQRVIAGDRRATARMISLVEKGGAGLRRVMQELHPATGSSYSIGITGAPGAGKSTLTERLVGRARLDNHHVAVVAIDPSSPFSGGALLGDRVRMQSHATDSGVFIRSMAARGHLGGLSLAAPEAVRVLEAAGAEYIFIETVGVGQAEVEISDACDTTLVVVNPGWGDAVQTAKAGLMEVADIFVVNKADRPGAREAVRELRGMLDLADAGWKPAIVAVTATKGEGIEELWVAVEKHRGYQEEHGLLEARRRARVEREIKDIVAERHRARVAVDEAELLARMTDEVVARRLDPYSAADAIDRALNLSE